MLPRLIVREHEKPETARRRFDGQLTVRRWETPGVQLPEETPQEKNAPWWWSKAEAEASTREFMAMARAKGMIE